jgi:hypothetical protein
MVVVFGADRNVMIFISPLPAKTREPRESPPRSATSGVETG